MRPSARIRQYASKFATENPGVAFDLLDLASKVAEATNLPQAEELVRQGHAALGRHDKLAVKTIVDRLWSLMPPSVEQRRRGFDSGLR